MRPMLRVWDRRRHGPSSVKRRRLAANRWASPGGSGEVLVERGDEPLGRRREAEDEAASLAAVQVIADVLAAYDLHGDDVKLDARAVVGHGPSRCPATS
jgi:hypothetical protein